MEELFFRGLLFKALARLFTPVVTAGRARGLGVVLAVILVAGYISIPISIMLGIVK